MVAVERGWQGGAMGVEEEERQPPPDRQDYVAVASFRGCPSLSSAFLARACSKRLCREGSRYKATVER